MPAPLYQKVIFTEHIECEKKPKGYLRVMKYGNWEFKCDMCLFGIAAMNADNLTEHYKKELNRFILNIGNKTSASGGL